MAFTIGKLARKVIGLGTQVEPADRTVGGATLGVAYSEPLPGGGYNVELGDGSRWTLPAKTQAAAEIDWTYTELANRT